MAKKKPKAAQPVRGQNLIARADGLLCTVCGEIEPIHVGESGTPLPTLMHAYGRAMDRHPTTPHDRLTPDSQGRLKGLTPGKDPRFAEPKGLSTEDCQAYLVEHFAQRALDRYSLEDAEDADPEWKKDIEKIHANAKNPKMWKRVTKFNVGSKTDMEGGGGHYTGMRFGECKEYKGTICRIFYLEGTDHITIGLFEKDGKILDAHEDLSD